MKKIQLRIVAMLMVVFTAIGYSAPAVYAEDTTDEAVLAVIEQLEAIDTLEQMQAKRYTYKVTNAHYDTGTTDVAIIEEHTTARTGYETYVASMFAARTAAQQGYDALTDDQKEQIDPELVAKLDNYLPTVFNPVTCDVTPGGDEYIFDTVKGGAGYAYEVSNHMVAGNIPQTFILVDASDGKTSWTPNGLYEYGESNYEVAYCCDVETSLEYSTDYKRVNLEDSNYYSDSAARQIRAILMNAYPFVTVDEMKASLKAGGLDSDFVDSLTRADMIAAVQMAIWTYANSNDGFGDGSGYFASIDTVKNTGIYFTPLHDYTNECWDWLPGKRQRSYDARAAYRVNNLAYYLCTLEGVEAEDDQIVISDVEVTRTDLIPGDEDAYYVAMEIYIDGSGSDKDQLTLSIYSYHTNEDGSVEEDKHGENSPIGSGGKEYAEVRVRNGDTIKIIVEGTQYLAKGVYFYEPRGGRKVSQSLVGVGEGETSVRAETEFVFIEDVTEMGLRIYKTERWTGRPISDIVFNVYRVEGGTQGATPTEEEISRYAVGENLVATGTTDTTGYTGISLGEGTYLIVEEHNEDKIVAPVDPFYINLPMDEIVENIDGTTSVEIVNIVEVYPKNETKEPPEEPPIVPPTTDDVVGQFAILKCDAEDQNVLLAGAQFEIYRAATSDDSNTKTVSINGVDHTVAPVTVNGAILALTTDENGYAISPELPGGTYFLVETKAPDGYNLMEDAVVVTVVSNNMTSIATVKIPNDAGEVLPITGGSGSRFYLAMGGVLVMSAVVALIAKRRIGTAK